MKILRKYWVNIVIVIGLAVFSYFSVAHRAPINQDEFSQYLPLICHTFENNKLNVFREACSKYDLVLPGTTTALPLRAYDYAGALPSLYYLPLYLIWPSPESVRMMGFIFILIQAWVISKLIRQRYIYVAIGLTAFFPYLYQNMIDTGIIHFYGTAVLFAVYFLQRWFTTGKKLYVFGAAIWLLLGLWTRLTFVFAAPALVLLFIAFGWRYYPLWKPHLKKMLAGASIAILIFAFVFGMYLFSSAPGDPGHSAILTFLGKTGSVGWLDLLKPATYLHSQLLRRFLGPLETTSRAYIMQNIDPLQLFYSAILFLTPILIMLWQFIKSRRKQGRVNLKALLFYLLFLITAIFLFKSTQTNFAHHSMMSYPFLILSWGFLLPDLFKLWGKKLTSIFLILLVVFNLYYFAIYTRNQVEIYDDASKVQVNQVLNNEYLGKNYFYVVIDWGMYFYQGLYGPKDQSVLYIEDFTADPATLAKLTDYQKQYNRKLLFIYIKQVPEPQANVIKYDPALTECGLTKTNSTWGILLDTDNSSLNPCR